MKEKIISVSIALVLILSVLSVAFVPTVSSSPAVPDCEPIDVGPRLRKSTVPVDMGEPLTEPGHHSYYNVGDKLRWFVYDDYYGYLYRRNYTLKAIGILAEVWVADDTPYFRGMSFPETTPPKPNPTNPPIITDDEITYILNEFETNIYPTDTAYYGMPDFHDGSYSPYGGAYYEETGRTVILISNVRDEHYWTDYPYYIAGFYWGTYEYYFDRNIISIDCYDWEHRLGPEGTEWLPGQYVTRPYLYDGVFAHEFQHLIHADYNPGDDSFMNEGCSMFAEILCGYGPSWSDINSFLYTPDNSLTLWGDQGDINILADYGAAQLWAVYLNDHYGEEFLGYFVQTGIPSIDGVNAALEHFGYKERFDDVYHDWRLANLIHADFPGCGKYNYKTIDLREANPVFNHTISGLPVPLTKGTDFGTTKTILGYDTGVSMVGPYGSDYIVLKNWKKLGLISFDGDDRATPTYEWIYLADEGMWYSGAHNRMDILLGGSTYVDLANPTLELTTYWDIEDYWDFGFVQVSTDGGKTWVSLENEYTTWDHDPDAMGSIVANLPGLTSWSGYITPDGWVTMEFDLSAYAGQTVLIGFRYMTDAAVLYEGWYISSASVSSTPLELTSIYPEADFMVTAVYAFVMGKCTIYVPVDMWLSDKTEVGTTFGLAKPSYTILIVSSKSQQGFVDYSFKATPLKIPICMGRMTE